MRSRPSWFAYTAVAIVLVLTAGCDRSPAQHLDLAGTDWIVASTDGQPIPEGVRASLSIDEPRSGWVTLETGCRRIQLPFAYDTDGDALSFDLSAIRPGSCTGEAKATDAAIIETLRNAMSWRLVGDADIEIRGPNRLTLTRVEP